VLTIAGDDTGKKGTGKETNQGGTLKNTKGANEQFELGSHQKNHGKSKEQALGRPTEKDNQDSSKRGKKRNDR